MIKPDDFKYRRGIGFPVVWKVLTALFTLALIPIWGFPLLLAYLNGKESYASFGLLLLVLSAGASFWIARPTAYKMEFEGHTFKSAFQHTVYPYVGMLSCLPFVGSLFEKLIDPEKYQNQFVDRSK
jgi:hypothetical protein